MNTWRRKWTIEKIAGRLQSSIQRKQRMEQCALFFFWRGEINAYFRAQNDQWQHLTRHDSLLRKLLFGVLSQHHMRLYIVGLQSNISNGRTLHDRGHLAKNNIQHSHGFINTTWVTFNNSVFSNFFLKSNSPEPFFQGVFLVSTYRFFLVIIR